MKEDSKLRLTITHVFVGARSPEAAGALHSALKLHRPWEKDYFKIILKQTNKYGVEKEVMLIYVVVYIYKVSISLLWTPHIYVYCTSA